MPELPEVESVARTLRDGMPSLIGKTVQSVRILRANVINGDGAAFCDQMQGARFVALQRHGKYLFFCLHTATGSSRWLALHLRMTGRLFLVDAAQAKAQHTRLVCGLDGNLALRFDDPRAFGRAWLIKEPSEVTTGLGPDALSIDEAWFMKRLTEQRRQLKPLLLDQSFVAGLGNIYVDESLFRAGLHPLCRTDQLRDKDRQRLYGAIHDVLDQAVACQGANINRVFEAGNFPVAVYGSTGCPCPVCGTGIVKIRVGQRGTHLCPRCQEMQ